MPRLKAWVLTASCESHPPVAPQHVLLVLALPAHQAIEIRAAHLDCLRQEQMKIGSILIPGAG